MFAISANSLPTIQTYQQARKFWSNAKLQDGPFRALNPRNKRDTSKRVWSPDEGGTICFRLHHTDLVEYTNDTLRIRAWDSRSSIIFINELVPHEIYARSHPFGMYVNNMRPDVEGIVFRRTEGKWYEPDLQTRLPDFQTVVDRKIVAKARKSLDKFFKYRAAHAALTGDRLPTGLMTPIHLVQDKVRLHHEDETYFSRLYELVAHCSNDVLLRSLVANLGGVSKFELPPGTLPTKSVYDVFTRF